MERASQSPVIDEVIVLAGEGESAETWEWSAVTLYRIFLHGSLPIASLPVAFLLTAPFRGGLTPRILRRSSG